jgi:hypothetical protein
MLQSCIDAPSINGEPSDVVATSVDRLEYYQEDLPVNKSLPIFWASYYFCAPGDLTLLYEVYRLQLSRWS